jgi:hypothetical protein
MAIDCEALYSNMGQRMKQETKRAKRSHERAASDTVLTSWQSVEARNRPSRAYQRRSHRLGARHSLARLTCMKNWGGGGQGDQKAVRRGEIVKK